MGHTTGLLGGDKPAIKEQRRTYWTCFWAGVVGGLIATICVVIMLFWFVDVDFIKNANCGSKNGFNYCFFDDKWDSGEYLSAITTFYASLITILIGLLAVLATLAFLVVRASASHQSQEVMEAEVARYFASAVAERWIDKRLSELSETKASELTIRLETVIAVLEEDGYDFPGVIQQP